ncbi:hypothetical protein AALO_G00195360 [Alosa alosa]|uniref:Uncharacterized protein n=1 Tax=Alosa alosa TaxID=278164 RepID=A0AAV6G6C3_9TELE|nr:hypothetical protein AALO_G00195360 [Alosa alosa]
MALSTQSQRCPPAKHDDRGIIITTLPPLWMHLTPRLRFCHTPLSPFLLFPTEFLHYHRAVGKLLNKCKLWRRQQVPSVDSVQGEYPLLGFMEPFPFVLPITDI